MINADKKSQWDADIAQSVEAYNEWYLRFASAAFRGEQAGATARAERAFLVTEGLGKLTAEVLKVDPGILSILRMCTCPPIARDRLAGFSGVSSDLIETLEKGGLPPKTKPERLAIELSKIVAILRMMLDDHLFPWVPLGKPPEPAALLRTASIVADRACAAAAGPIIRNAQEKRQLAEITGYLNAKGYFQKRPEGSLDAMEPGTFAFIVNVMIPTPTAKSKFRKIPVDAIIQPRNPQPGKLPIMIEAKSAGDFTNTNKRQKEEGNKGHRLRTEFKGSLTYVLFLCGYFGETYLQYEADEGFDWIWEHRISDLDQLGL